MVVKCTGGALRSRTNSGGWWKVLHRTQCKQTMTEGFENQMRRDKSFNEDVLCVSFPAALSLSASYSVTSIAGYMHT